MHEYLRKKKEELGKRSDSLNPPYPAFMEFIQDLLGNGVRAQEIASLIINTRTDLPIQEEVVNAWAGGKPPGLNLRGTIRKQFGYDFQERVFCEVATAMRFPGPQIHPELQSIRSMYALRLYMVDVVKKIGVQSLTAFCEISSSAILGDFYRSEEKGVAEETLQKILKNLNELPKHLSGEILSEFTPKLLVSKLARECRQKRGMNRAEYARHVGLDHHYYRYIEELVEKAKQGANVGEHSQGLDRIKQLCERLTQERIELGVVEEAVAPIESEPLSLPPPTVADEPAPSPAAASPLPIREAGSEVVSQVAELLTRLDALRPHLDAVLHRTPPSAANSERYVSPFAHERWHPHDVPVDETRVKAVRGLIVILCEELGHLAAVRDEAVRTQIRGELNDPLMVELVGAIDLFGQQYPGAAIRLMESWRRELKI